MADIPFTQREITLSPPVNGHIWKIENGFSVSLLYSSSSLILHRRRELRKLYTQGYDFGTNWLELYMSWFVPRCLERTSFSFARHKFEERLFCFCCFVCFSILNIQTGSQSTCVCIYFCQQRLAMVAAFVCSSAHISLVVLHSSSSRYRYRASAISSSLFSYLS